MSKVSGMIEQYKHESWKIAHDRAMQVWEFDDWLAMGLSFLKFIQEKENQYYAQLRAGQVELDKGCIEAIQALYEQWYEACKFLLEGLAYYEQEGFELRHAEVFRAASKFTNIPGFEADRLQSALERARQGPRHSSKEVRDELQGRIRRRREGSASKAS